jgi:hypothetical protein
MTDTPRRRARPLVPIGWTLLVAGIAINMTEVAPLLVAWALYLGAIGLGAAAALRGSVVAGLLLLGPALAVAALSFVLVLAAASV